MPVSSLPKLCTVENNEICSQAIQENDTKRAQFPEFQSTFYVHFIGNR
jgi:hypothetical protein